MPQTLHPVSSLCTLTQHYYSRCTPLVNTHPHPVAPPFSFFASSPLREARVVSPPRRRGVPLAGQRAVPALVRSRPAASVVGRLAIGPVGVEALRRLRLGSLVYALLHGAEARGRDGPVLLAGLVRSTGARWRTRAPSRS